MYNHKGQQLDMGEDTFRMQNDNFGLTDDVSPAKTHPNELFLKAMWNMFMKGDLSDMNVARPYRCTQWNDERNQACIIDFICFTIFEESAIIEDFKVFKTSYSQG